MKKIKPFLILLLIIATSCTSPVAIKYDKPIGLIDKKTEILYEKNYVNHQFKYINQHVNDRISNNNQEQESKPKYTDNREIYFTLENLENYLAYVKKKSKEKGYEKLGIRVYLGAKKEADNTFRTTVFFVPTHKNTNRAIENQNTNSNDIEGLNFGSAGRPPADLNGN